VRISAQLTLVCETNPGTWVKRSILINGRKPFAKDDEALEYDFDSEEEWEEEEPGEDITSEKGLLDDDEEEVPEEDEEDGWLVPHGYLSDDEGIQEVDAERAPRPKEVKEEQKRKVEALAPVIVAPCYASSTFNFLPFTIQLFCTTEILDPFFMEVDARRNLTPERLEELKRMVDGKKCNVSLN
jgi:Chromatin assembly factor 1 subunit A